MSGSAAFHGFRELDRALAELGDPRVATRIGRTAVRKGAVKYAAAAKSALPVGTRSTLRRRKRKDGTVAEADYGRVTTQIRVRLVKVSPAQKQVVYTISTGSAFWWWMNEFGFAGRPANPVLRTTWASEQGGILDGLAADLGKGIASAAKRMGRANATGRSI
jgi:hypothetical protein